MFRESQVSNQFSMKSSFFWMKDEHRQLLADGWAGCFRKNITEMIDEVPYAVLYSDLPSRPNAPIRVVIGMMLIESLFHMSESEVRLGTIFDMQIQYALGIENTENIDISERTLQRFRKACITYEAETGKDLLHDTIVALAKNSAYLMDIDGTKFRMDSMMIESNIYVMSRTEILFQVMQNLAFSIAGVSKKSTMAFLKNQQAVEQQSMDGQQSLAESVIPEESPAVIKARKAGLPESLLHYLDPYDGNVVLYHSKKSSAEKRDLILSDVKTFMEFCGEKYVDIEEYRLFARAVEEQCKKSYDHDADGNLTFEYVLRGKGDGMNSSILQNPSDPDATIREKEGYHRGYVGNVLEATGDAGSIVYDYEYDVNTTSDNELGARTLERLGVQETDKGVTVTVDAAFSGDRIDTVADKNNIDLIHTNLTGQPTNSCHADHIINDEGSGIEKCAGGQTPLETHVCGDGSFSAKMDLETCKACPYYEECHPRKNRKTAVLHLTRKQILRALEAKSRGTISFAAESRYRNGVETIPSILRRRYRVDEMPVRGLKRTRFRFGLDIGGLNFMKLWSFMRQGVSAPKIAVC